MSNAKNIARRLARRIALAFRSWKWAREARAAGIPTMAEVYAAQGRS